MSVVFISPFSSKLHNGNINPKNYPYWLGLIELLNLENHEIVQVGVGKEPKLVRNVLFDKDMKTLKEAVVNRMDFFISVDLEYVRQNQFETWEQCAYNEAVFETPVKVMQRIKSVIKL
jgi:hypothetical protein